MRNPMGGFSGVIFFYYAAASRGILNGSSLFFAETALFRGIWLGIMLWLCSSTILAATWAICWGHRFKAIRLLVILIALSCPPIGIIGWANPLTSAGIYFPGLGWYGLMALVVLFLVLVASPRPTFILPFALVAITFNVLHTRAEAIPGWTAINTKLGGGQRDTDEFHRLQSLQSIVSKESNSRDRGEIIVLPELVGGDWSVNAMWWEDAEKALQKKDQTVLLGIHRPMAGASYSNSLISIGAISGRELEDRVPVPISMWKPWAEDGAVAHWWLSGTTQIKNKKVAHIICYEQILMWPILISAANSPDLLIAPSNIWWAKQTSVAEIQRQAMTSWGLLFDIPVLFAVNS
ncbi:hypothetical protein ACFQAT_29045 [Undibacterium arcticum]|uniref:hypothetical protein n=1 Tax=Undibacterium arcticum TaxID=1762892 RepID=UPI0036085E85